MLILGFSQAPSRSSSSASRPKSSEPVTGKRATAACGQVVGPINSVYWWEGKVDDATEWLVLFKTSADRSAALVEYVRSHHSYDVPEIIVTPILGGNPAYLAWVDDETRAR